MKTLFTIILSLFMYFSYSQNIYKPLNVTMDIYIDLQDELTPVKTNESKGLLVYKGNSYFLIPRIKQDNYIIFDLFMPKQGKILEFNMVFTDDLHKSFDLVYDNKELPYNLQNLLFTAWVKTK